MQKEFFKNVSFIRALG